MDTAGLLERVCPGLAEAVRSAGFPELAERLDEVAEALRGSPSCREDLEEMLLEYVSLKRIEWARDPRGKPPSITFPLVAMAVCNCLERLEVARRHKRS